MESRYISSYIHGMRSIWSPEVQAYPSNLSAFQGSGQLIPDISASEVQYTKNQSYNTAIQIPIQLYNTFLHSVEDKKKRVEENYQIQLQSRLFEKKIHRQNNSMN